MLHIIPLYTFQLYYEKISCIKLGSNWYYYTIRHFFIVCVRKETPMARRPIALLFACGFTSLAMMVAASIPLELSAASKSAKKPIRNPKFDPAAEQAMLLGELLETHHR